MRRPLDLAIALLATALGACAAAHRGPAGVALAWRSPLHRDHPLVGRIWDAREGRFATLAELRAAVARGRFVLLGEIHDNPDHHAIQARLLEAVLATGRRPALALEMLDPDQQEAVNAVLAGPAPSPAALAAAVGWDRSGWPAFAMYEPIFRVGMQARLPIVAANLPTTLARDVVHRGAEALTPPLRALLEAAGPLSPAEAGERREEMQASHCGQLPEALLDPMVLSQRARDAHLAMALVAGATGGGAVLVTGDEHARRDRAVGALLRTEGVAPEEIVSVGLREVDPAVTAPPGASASPAHDWIVFTPGVDRGDPCEGVRVPGAK
jgi:uncharacterized iron-regulated protein